MFRLLLLSTVILGALAGGNKGGPPEHDDAATLANRSALRGALVQTDVRQGIESRSDVGVLAHWGNDALGFERHAHLNCYREHGGNNSGSFDGPQSRDLVLSECANTAHYTKSPCFVYHRKKMQCFLRDHCELSQCEQGVEGEESYDFDTFTAGPVNAPCHCQHGQGEWIPYGPAGSLVCKCVSCDRGYTTKDMPCVPEQRESNGDSAGLMVANSSSMRGDSFQADVRQGIELKSPSSSEVPVLGYQKHANLHCYKGHGGNTSKAFDGLQSRDLHLFQCARTADFTNSPCFVYHRKEMKCFLRDHCELSECEQGVEGEESYDFDTFTAGPLGAPCFCELGHGVWIPFGPPGKLACSCASQQSGDANVVGSPNSYKSNWPGNYIPSKLASKPAFCRMASRAGSIIHDDRD
eukprot:TRINITY_DN383_c0_g2_i1.p1 TRINITY_DN383_c0_g2~~TRINITY_DN383_c0_g2_i1.p1  ORF type:complete len:434 (-),score=18.02 TRINITY_DN383_c0_g2_i1:789-2015(-)